MIWENGRKYLGEWVRLWRHKPGGVFQSIFAHDCLNWYWSRTTGTLVLQLSDALFSDFLINVLVYLLKGKWQQKFLSSYSKEILKQYIVVCYTVFISALFSEIFLLEILSCPPSWIFVDMHDSSQNFSRNFGVTQFFFLRHNDLSSPITTHMVSVSDFSTDWKGLKNISLVV